MLLCVKRRLINKFIKTIRKNWGASDAKRDAGLTTPENITRHDDLSYGPYGKWNLLDVYHGKDVTEKQPAIINVHGGGWVYGSKEVYQYYCMELAKRGFTVVNFNYRLATEHRYPAPLEDINRVLGFVKEHAEKYHIDTENLFMVGDSAGAQLAGQYLTIYANPDYAALFDFQVPEVTFRACALNCGLYDMEACILEKQNPLFEAYVGLAAARVMQKSGLVEENLKSIEYIDGNFPPAFIMTAYHDNLKVHGKPMYDLLTKKKVECVLKEYGSEAEKEVTHVFHVNCKLEQAKKCNDDTCAFFKEHMVSAEPEAATENGQVTEPVAIGAQEKNGEVRLKIKKETITPTGLTAVICNDSEEEINFGRDFLLEEEKDGMWQQVAPVAEPFMTMDLLWAPAGASEELTLFWEPFYGALKEGHYRLVKPVSSQRRRLLLTEEFFLKE